MEHEQELQQIAYHIWEEQGRPEGHDLEHWLKAEAVWRKRQGHAAPAFQPVAVAQQITSTFRLKDAGAQMQPRPPYR